MKKIKEKKSKASTDRASPVFDVPVCSGPCTVPAVSGGRWRPFTGELQRNADSERIRTGSEAQPGSICRQCGTGHNACVFAGYTIHYTNAPGKYKKFIRLAAQLPMLLPTITYGFAIIYPSENRGF